MKSNNKHPMQPISIENGVARFKGNTIIKWLFETKKLDLNEVSTMVRLGMFSNEDYVQITQLLNYSVSGWGDLSTSPPEMVAIADEIVQNLIKERDDK